MSDFLIELGTEELPPKSLRSLSHSFSAHIEKAFEESGLRFDSSESFATPRRLALLIKGADQQTPKQNNKVHGPPQKIAFDESGALSKAGDAFCKRNQCQQSDIKIDEKNGKIYIEQETGGESTSELLASFVKASLAALPIAKRMRWGASREEFVRPVHWLVLMQDDQIVDAEVFGLKSSNRSRGHRFHCQGEVTISTASEYEHILLDQGGVTACFDKRKAEIVKQVNQAAQQHQGQAVISEDLLDEVCALVEQVHALCGKFDERFLSVPAEALISSMKEHQKYFHVIDAHGALMPLFITVSNVAARDPAVVIDGNERVIRPRLADAAFFFETDKKSSLSSLRERLKTVVFQAKLGSIYDKTQRLESLSAQIASALNFSEAEAARAAGLSKSDLVSSMVYEFSDMQGIAGYHYAINDGESEAVALAIQEQYLPKFASDDLPESDAGIALALADRIDTLVGIFGIGLKPSGSKDPFALRRASVGVLRILVEKQLDIDLGVLINNALHLHASSISNENTEAEVIQYILERMRAWYEESYATEVFLSVAAKNLKHPLDIDRRIKAVAEFSKKAEAQALAAANKRVANILAKQESEITGEFNSELAEESAEMELAKSLDSVSQKVSPLIASANYSDAMEAMASLGQPVDQFFDQVMVMCDNADVRQNRLILLTQLRNLFLQIADISCLAISNK
jgi:glycyl-tRNA synthetase beta chain